MYAASTRCLNDLEKQIQVCHIFHVSRSCSFTRRTALDMSFIDARAALRGDMCREHGQVKQHRRMHPGFSRLIKSWADVEWRPAA